MTLSAAQHVDEIHRELELARTPRDLRALLRAASIVSTGHLNDCLICSFARDRIEDPATVLHGRVEHDLSWQPPRSPQAIEQIERLRTAAKSFAHELIESTPVTDEQSRALESIDDALSHAIAAIVRDQGEGRVRTLGSPHGA